MNKLSKIFLSAIVCLSGAFSLKAQTVDTLSVPYSFSFEESQAEELSRWVLNPGDNNTFRERWIVGKAAHSDGKQGLYISNNGMDDNFGVATLVQYTYRDFVLPQGTYECSFDWRCQGAPTSSLFAGVYDQATIANMCTASTTNTIPSAVLTGCQSNNRYMRGHTRWQHSDFKFTSNGQRVIRMYFIWGTSNSDTTIVAPIAACIDNIQITKADCVKPYDVQAEIENDVLNVTWGGTSEQYVFEYRKVGRDKWNVNTGVYEEKYTIEGLDEGVYDIRVRGVCNDVDSSAYAYLNTFLVYYPDRHCIDFVHLDGNPNVECAYGTFPNPAQNIGMVDYGPDEKMSRHTVNLEPEVYDPRTNNMLSTIAPNSLASVRLGNWNNGGEAEQITFKYLVDSVSALLLMHYAVVLQDPDHSEQQQPRFTLEILDSWDDLINPSCGYADFYADKTREGWHTVGSGGDVVTWKDWTTIGLDLTEFIGEEISIRMTTRDCSMQAHYGYAYFSLECAAAQITGTSCGDDAQMSIAAPDGFLYEWFDKYDQPVAETMLSADGRTLYVDPSDTTTYRCHLTYLEEASCGLDLYSAALPRFPIASFDWQYDPSDCKNKVRFTNKSHIMTKFNNNVEYHLDWPCDEYEWAYGSFGVGSDKNPVVIFPAEGGTFPVTLFASIAEGRCVDDTTIYITIPAIGDKEVYIDTTICEGSYLILGPQYIGMEGEFQNTWRMDNGCDSTVYLTMHLHPQSNTFIGDTTVCAEEPLIIGGQQYKLHESGEFHRFYQNRYGCDSTVWMNVIMKDSILFNLEVTDITEDRNTGDITITSGSGYDYYYINGERNGQLTNLYGGQYILEFFNDFGCSVLDTVNIGCLLARPEQAICGCESGNPTQVIIPLTVDSGSPTYYSLLFEDSVAIPNIRHQKVPLTDDGYAVIVDLPAAVRAGRYNAQLLLEDYRCQDDTTFNIYMDINYAADIVFQRWNDVLSVKNVQYSGYDDMASFEWFKNGSSMGETLSYIYVPEGLDADDEYYVRITNTNGITIPTCVFSPEDEAEAEEVDVYPTQLPSGTALNVNTPTDAVVQCYNSLGQMLLNTTVRGGHSTVEIAAPQGVYVLTVTNETGKHPFRISVE